MEKAQEKKPAEEEVENFMVDINPHSELIPSFNLSPNSLFHNEDSSFIPTFREVGSNFTTFTEHHDRLHHEQKLSQQNFNLMNKKREMKEKQKRQSHRFKLNSM